MLEQNLSPGPAKERRQLAILTVGLGVISLGLWWVSGKELVLACLMLCTLLAGAGWAWYVSIGRDVYLLFAVAGLLMGRVVSWVMIRVIYGLAILGFGSILRLFGMDHLNKRFIVCKARATMFLDAPGTDRESFGRQS